MSDENESISDDNDNETSDLRDALTEAVGKVETANEETLGMAEASDGAVPLPEGDKPDDTPTPDEDKDKPEETETPEGDEDVTDIPKSKEGDKPEAKAAGKYKVPVGWNATSKEHWSKIPEGVQKQIVAREDEVARTIHGTLDARKTHEWLSNLSNSYAPVLAAEGVGSPAEAIEGLFKTVSELRLGSPVQKAAKIAEIINTYGIDIPTLDTVLSGQAPAAGAEGGGVDPNIEHLINEKMAPFNQVLTHLNTMQQGQVEGRQKAANDAVTTFSEDAEFINDVRDDMADLLDLADKHGRQLSLQEAYTKACSLNPEVSKVIAERGEKEALLEKKKKAVDKINAGSSIRGQGAAGAGSADQNMSLRDQISSIWDSYAE